MKIYLIGTPEIGKDLLDETIEVLNATPGVMEFEKLETLTNAQISILLNDYPQKERLSSNEFFQICEGYRVLYGVDTSSFLVIVSDKNHDHNWFSAFRGNNIFVIGRDWDLFIEAEHKFGIAHQIVENIFQTLIKLDIESGQLDPLIHYDRPIGCVNDFCGTKKDIEYKILTARICNDCLQRAGDENMDRITLTNIISQFENIRSSILRSTSQLDNILPPLKISKHGEISVQNVEIKLQPLEKATYILFAKELGGISRNRLHEKVVKINSNYKILTNREFDERKVPSRFGYEIIPSDELSNEEKVKAIKLSPENYLKGRDPKRDSFRKVITDIKSRIENTLGPILFEKYIIQNQNTLYKIDLPQRCVNNEFPDYSFQS